MKLLLLQAAGLAHFGILTASAAAPLVLDWRGQFKSLPPLLRQMFWVYGAFIVLVIVSFGTLTLLFAPTLVAGPPLARGLCAFIALFWLARLGVQFFVFDLRPYTTNAWLRLGSHALTATFIFLSATYGWAALQPGEVAL